MAQTDRLYDRDAFCPFYRGTRGKTSILCEGPIARSWITLTLKNRKAFDSYRSSRCNTKDCEECPVYKIANEKYEE